LLIWQRLDIGGACGDVVGDPQGCHDADAPGSAEIAQRAQVGAFRCCLVTCHLLFLLIGFFLVPVRAPRPDLDLCWKIILISTAKREKHWARSMAPMLA
jgi:hypothetical protein